MIVTLTGAFKNSGDYLIGHRARNLLAKHLDHEVIDFNRKAITDDSYRIFNSAKAVLLTGGPAYQAGIYPGVYNLDLSRIEVPVIAYGLGWKGKLGQDPKDFEFKPEAKEFLTAIHQGNYFSSARDYLTTEVLHNLGIGNVSMTGCPAWYDEAKLDSDFEWQEVETLVFSMPAVQQDSVLPILRYLAKRFPKAKKYLAYNAGYKSTRAKDADQITRWNYKIMALAALKGFESVSYESDFAKFQLVQSKADLHVGFRVHSHIFSLSQRITSVLIAEDSRGTGQQQAMGSPQLSASLGTEELIASIESEIDSRGESSQRAINTMRATHPKMVEFISQFA
ncbi:MAG: hypothetical protein RL068_522 [Actinomycetota bacterium]|jgi:hypothetical protein